MDKADEYMETLHGFSEDQLREEAGRVFQEKLDAEDKVLEYVRTVRHYQENDHNSANKHWDCPVCDGEWGIFAPECPNCGYRRGLEFQEFGPVYIAQPGTPVIIGERTDHEYRTAIVSHCSIKGILHYIVSAPASGRPGRCYRIVSGGELTKL